MTVMNTPDATAIRLIALNDVEVYLFGERSVQAANMAAYVEHRAGVPVAFAAANERPFLPEPPKARRHADPAECMQRAA